MTIPAIRKAVVTTEETAHIQMQSTVLKTVRGLGLEIAFVTWLVTTKTVSSIMRTAGSSTHVLMAAPTHKSEMDTVMRSA